MSEPISHKTACNIAFHARGEAEEGVVVEREVEDEDLVVEEGEHGIFKQKEW